jgi:putative methionine-R-sulfoxide reductase with GAF domain
MELTSSQKYHLLLEISHNIRDTLDADAIMAHILATLQSVVDYDAAGIFVLNQSFAHSRGNAPDNMIAGMCWRGHNPQPTGSDEMLRHGKGITGYVIQTGQSLIVSDVRKDQRYVEARPNK